MLPDLALGATIAAVIGALATLLGLVITKEQKTSDFRQAWIDALREDLANYVTHVNVIADASAISYSSNEKKIAALSSAYTELNRANFRINLRINRNENLSNKVLTCMGNFNTLITSGDGLTPENIRQEETAFLEASQDLLKYEWQRVKRGEGSFRLAKSLAGAVLLLAPIAIAYGILAKPYDRSTNDAKPAEVGPAVTNAISPAPLPQTTPNVSAPQP